MRGSRAEVNLKQTENILPPRQAKVGQEENDYSVLGGGCKWEAEAHDDSFL